MLVDVSTGERKEKNKRHVPHSHAPCAARDTGDNGEVGDLRGVNK